MFRLNYLINSFFNKKIIDKHLINLGDIIQKKVKANSARFRNKENNSISNKIKDEEYFSIDSISDNSNNGNINKIKINERNYLKTEYLRKNKTFQVKDAKFIFDESREIDLNMQDHDLSRGLIYNLDENDSFEKMENLDNDIERILIDIYNNHIKSDKKKTSLDISKYERYITSLSLSLDKYNNLIILQIFEEKIKDLIEVILKIFKVLFFSLKFFYNL